MPFAALAIMPHISWLEASLPLLQAGEVEALELSFDMLWTPAGAAPWLTLLTDTFAREGRLYGHGVNASMLSADDEVRQGRWFEELRKEVRRRSYRHISEHWGYTRCGTLYDGTPLPLPICTATFELALAGLSRLGGAAGVPVGLENLALAFSREEVLALGPFLAELLEAADSFLVLDLHNLWCQAENFNLPLELLISRLPLQKIREIHLSGGSWSQARLSRRLRRDTHDDRIPEQLFALLPQVIASCPKLEVVVLEQLGDALRSPMQQQGYREDFGRIRRLLETPASQLLMQPAPMASLPLLSHQALASWQATLVDGLTGSLSAAELIDRLQKIPDTSSLSPQVSVFDPDLLATAAELLGKWGRDTRRQHDDWLFL